MFRSGKQFTNNEKQLMGRLKGLQGECTHCPDRAARIRSKMWAYIEDATDAQPSRVWPMVRNVAFMMTGIVLVVMTGFGTVEAADRSAPGDTLYPLDRAVEQMRFAITLDADKRTLLRLKAAEERVYELDVVKSRRAVYTDADGVDTVVETVTFVPVPPVEYVQRADAELATAKQKFYPRRGYTTQRQTDVQEALNTALADLERAHYRQVEMVHQLATQMDTDEYERVREMHYQLLRDQQRIWRELAAQIEAEGDVSVASRGRGGFPEFPKHSK